MTKQEIILIDAINNFEISPENIPIEVIQAFSKLKQKIHEINRLEKPNFTKNNQLIDMKYWNDFKFIGMNACDFVETDFYKYGFKDNSDLEDY
jgi:hypothetical protein